MLSAGLIGRMDIVGRRGAFIPTNAPEHAICARANANDHPRFSPAPSKAHEICNFIIASMVVEQQ
jgi:hypothetical protein